MERSDVGQLAWGATELLKLIKQMNEEAPLWTNHQLEEIIPTVDIARQVIIQCFPEWLGRQDGA